MRPITARFEHYLDNHKGWDATGRKHFKTILKEFGLYQAVASRLEGSYEDVEKVLSSLCFDGIRQFNIVEKPDVELLPKGDGMSGREESEVQPFDQTTL